MSQPKELNGIDVDRLQSSLESIGEQAKDADKASEMNIRRARALWLSGLRVKVFSGRTSFQVDEPVEPNYKSESPTAVEYLLGSLAACVAVGFVYNATLKRIRVEAVEVSATGRINNILSFLGLSSDGHPGYEEVTLKTYVRSDAPEEVLKTILEQSVATSPVANSLSRRVAVKTELKLA